jgi:hypothetical protein
MSKLYVIPNPERTYIWVTVITFAAALVTAAITGSVVSDVLSWLFISLALMSFMAIFESKWCIRIVIAIATGMIVSRLVRWWDNGFAIQDIQWASIMGILLALCFFIGLVQLIDAKAAKV